MDSYIIVPDEDVAMIESIERQSVKMECMTTIDGKKVLPICNIGLFGDLLINYKTIELSDSDFPIVHDNLNF